MLRKLFSMKKSDRVTYINTYNDFEEKSTRPEQASCARYVQRVSLSEWKTRPVSQ